MKWLARLQTNQRLALVAFVLGVVAIGARPAPGPGLSVDARDLEMAVQRGADQVMPLDLADWIVQGRADYRLLDLRSADDYATYHIPGAESVPLATLTAASIPRNEKLVVYAQDGVRASQAWFLLRASGVRAAYILSGGMDRWKHDVLFPVLSEAATADARALNAKLEAVSAHFGGSPVRAGGAPSSAAPVEAKLPPPPPPVKAAAAPQAKKKEGC